MNLNKLAIRTLSGAIYCLIVIGCILWGETGVIVLAGMLSALATMEFASISKDFDKRHYPTILLDIAGCIALTLGFLGYPLIIWLFIILCRLIEELYINSDSPLKSISHSLMTQIYIGLPMGLMTGIAWIFHPYILLAIFFFLWINDTGAFLVGCSIGRHKMFPRISPKKTWEGFFGGLIFTLIASILFWKYCNSFFGMTVFHANIITWLGLAAIVVAFGTWGDLVESMIKRNLQIKDSGKIIPGHGGILDRIDSLLLALPAVTVYFALLIYTIG